MTEDTSHRPAGVLLACGRRYVIPGPDPGSHQAEYICSRPQGHYAEPHHDAAAGVSWSRAGDLRPTSLAAGMASVDALTALCNERGELIAKYRAAMACEGPCICPAVEPEGIDPDNLCPRHGIVAELGTQLWWANSFTHCIVAALPSEWRSPLHSANAAEEIVRRLRLAEQVEAVGLAAIIAECERGDR